MAAALLDRLLALLPEALSRPRVLAAAGVATVVGVLALRSLAHNARIWFYLRGLPKPGGRIPFFGHALMLSAGCPWEIMESFVKQYKYSMVVVDFLMQSGILLADPTHLRRVFDRNQRNYVKDTELSYKPFMDLLGNGIITSAGADWERQRRLLSGAFRIEILEETAPVAKRAVDRLSRKLDAAAQRGTPVDIAEEFRVLTLQVISELILGLDPAESERVFPALYLPIVEEANLRVWYPWRAFLPTPTNWHYHRTLKALNTYLLNLVVERWKKHQQRGKDASGPKDILDRIMDALDPNEWNEASGVAGMLMLTLMQAAAVHLRDEIKSFLLAGHETSASMLTWTVFELTQNAAVVDKVLAEGRTVFPAARGTAVSSKDEYDVSPLPTTAELKKLSFTENCLRESLRKYSPVPVVSRVALADDNLGDVFIPAGTKIFVNIKAVHWNPAFWPEPSVYRPERFQAEYDPYTFLPFINGPRLCLGQHLALLESRILLSLLTQRFVFEPVLGAAAARTHTYMVPVCPAEGMQMRVRRRA